MRLTFSATETANALSYITRVHSAMSEIPCLESFDWIGTGVTFVGLPGVEDPEIVDDVSDVRAAYDTLLIQSRAAAVVLYGAGPGWDWAWWEFAAAESATSMSSSPTAHERISWLYDSGHVWYRAIGDVAPDYEVENSADYDFGSYFEVAFNLLSTGLTTILAHWLKDPTARAAAGGLAAPDLESIDHHGEKLYWKSTLDRVLDRLGCNVAKATFGGGWERQAEWNVVGGWSEPVRRTPIGFAPLETDDGRSINPWMAWRKSMLTEENSGLGFLFKLPQQDSFALPLDWAEARMCGLVPPSKVDDVDFVPSAELAGGRSSFADLGVLGDSLESLPEVLRDVSNVLDTTGDIAQALYVTAVGAPSVMSGAVPTSPVVTLITLCLLTVDEVWDIFDLVEDLADAVDDLTDLAEDMEPETPLNEFAVDFLGALGGFPTDEVSQEWLGCDDNEALVLRRAFSSAAMPVPSLYTYGDADPPPSMIVIGPKLQECAWTFRNFRTGDLDAEISFSRPTPGTVARKVWNAWRDWWEHSSQLYDLALVIDGASLILEQLILIDDALLSLYDLIGGPGVVGSGVRQLLDEVGVGGLIRALDGRSPTAALRLCVRQLLTDELLAKLQAESEGLDMDCVYSAFCWYDTEEKRSAVAAALGPLTTITEGPLTVTLRDLSQGAFGALVATLTSGGASGLSAVFGAANEADVAAVRTWLSHAEAASACDCRESMLESIRTTITELLPPEPPEYDPPDEVPPPDFEPPDEPEVVDDLDMKPDPRA